MLVLLSTTLNHKDVTYRRQTPSSNSSNTCNILFNTGFFFWDKQQNPLKGALSMIPHFRPVTRTTCQKLSDQLGCIHMHTEPHVKNASMLFWFSSKLSGWHMACLNDLVGGWDHLFGVFCLFSQWELERKEKKILLKSSFSELERCGKLPILNSAHGEKGKEWAMEEKPENNRSRFSPQC